MEGVIEEICDTLHIMIRRLAVRNEMPSLGIIDSRSIKSSYHIDTNKGIDGNKKIKGRKEHVVLDKLVLPMGVIVHAANMHDGVEAQEVIDTLRGKYPKLKKLLADGGYKGQKLIDAAKINLMPSLKLFYDPMNPPKNFL